PGDPALPRRSTDSSPPCFPKFGIDPQRLHERIPNPQPLRRRLSLIKDPLGSILTGLWSDRRGWSVGARSEFGVREMELTISKRSFWKGLARTHGVADRKSSMPILSNILLTTESTNALRLAATDLHLGVSALSEAQVTGGGSVAVAARTLFDIVKNLPDGEVKWSVGPNHAAEIRCGKVKYRIPGMPGDDFPPLPSAGRAEFVELDADAVGDLIARTHFSMSTDDTRPHLAGALFEGDGKVVRMVTTDGHRLRSEERRVGKESRSRRRREP